MSRYYARVAAVSLGGVLLAKETFVALRTHQVTQVAGPQAQSGAQTGAPMGIAPCALVAAAALGVGAASGKARKSKVSREEAFYQRQKNAYIDFDFLNDVGYLPDGTPMHKAGNAVNHPEKMRSSPDPHADGSRLPRALFANSVGYMPDGTPMNAAGNAINHPERMQPDPHTPGSPLPSSVYAADLGYLVDGTPLSAVGNHSLKEWSPATPAASTGLPSTPSSSPPAFAPAISEPPGKSRPNTGAKLPYSHQKDVFTNPEYVNDVGYLPDGTSINRAGNAINHPELIKPDLHSPGAPLPRGLFTNSVGYMPDGTPMHAAGNAINHPERMQPDPHTPGSPLPSSVYAADLGYLVDGTPLSAVGNNSLKEWSAATPAASTGLPSTPPSSPPAFAPAISAPPGKSGANTGAKLPYSHQKDVFANPEYVNDVGYLPDGTPINRAGNAINHPELIKPDLHSPGAPLPRGLFTNSVGYMPDGTPMHAAGNAINHPERMQPDPHTPGSPLPSSVYAADLGCLADGTPLSAVGNNSLKERSPATRPASMGVPSTPASSLRAHSTFASEKVTPADSWVAVAANRWMQPEPVHTHERDAEPQFENFFPRAAQDTVWNDMIHPEHMQPDCHSPGSPLPRALFADDMGCLSDGTPMKQVGNAINHPERMKPDWHSPVSPLPESTFAADIGYLVDGTPLALAGNNSIPR